MSYFPHNQEDEYENPRLNRFENNYTESKSRNYSPENKDRITSYLGSAPCYVIDCRDDWESVQKKVKGSST